MVQPFFSLLRMSSFLLFQIRYRFRHNCCSIGAQGVTARLKRSSNAPTCLGTKYLDVWDSCFQ